MYVRSYYLLGQVALERGDLEEARTYYQRFLDHWADGDLDRDRIAQAKRVVRYRSRRRDGAYPLPPPLRRPYSRSVNNCRSS